MNREIEFEVYKKHSAPLSPDCIHKGHRGEIYVDFCVAIETAQRVAARIEAEPMNGCQMVAVTYRVNKTFVEIDPQTGETR